MILNQFEVRGRHQFRRCRALKERTRGLAQTASGGGLLLELANPSSKILRITVGKPSTAVFLFHQFAQVAIRWCDGRNGRPSSEMAIELGGSHQPFRFYAEGDQGQVCRCQGIGQIFEVLLGQKHTIAQIPVVHQLEQTLVLGPLANEEEDHIGIVTQEQRRRDHGDKVVATPLIA